MKKIILAVMMVFLVQNAAYADEDKMKGEKIEKVKGKVLEHINKKRGFLNDFESCVKSVNSREDMKACRKKNKQNMEALRAERKEMKEKRKEKRKDRREKRKNKD
ncbi:MAG: hypothetical protein HOB18_06955 [Nitrospina sp.]|nr:hypothetical protein [Nitrospina sp.]